MFLRTVELAFARFQARRDSRALAIVFDRTAPELLAVARHLASTEADAEDLVQATFLQAIEAAASHERGRPVLPWLFGILANQARSARRKARRAVDPGRLRAAAVADVHAEVAANELGAALGQAIGRLPDAYRPVLRLWFEHGLEAQEIAHTLERPAGTVRAQISRGLDQVRRMLPQGLASGVAIAAVGGRGIAAVRGAVLAASPGTSVGLVSTMAFGGLLVMHHKVLAVGTVLVLGLVGWSLGSGAEPPAIAAGVGQSPVVTAATGDLGAAPVATAESRREVAVSRGSPVASAAAVRSDAAAPTGELVVRLVSAAQQTPLAGIGVAVQRDIDLPTFSRVSDFVPTDAAGFVHFPGLMPATWHIHVDRIGVVAAGDIAAGSITERTVEVPAGNTVDGTVVDRGGLPVPGADIVVHGSRLCSPRVATTDALGRFRAEYLVAGVELQARKRGRAPSLAQQVAGAPGATVAMTLQLGDGGRQILGRALDAEGAPIRRGAVAVLPEAARDLTMWDRGQPQPRPLWLETDGDGRFVTDEAGVGRFLVLVQPPGSDATPCWATADTTSGDAVVLLRAAPPIVIEGRIVVRAALGAGITVSAWPRQTADIGFLLNLIGARHAETGADGTFRLSGLLPGEIELTARRGFDKLAETVMTLAAGETARWDPTVGESEPLRIRVQAPVELPSPLVLWIGPHVPDNSGPSIVPVNGGEGLFEGLRTGDVDVTAVVMSGGADIMQLARVSAVPMSAGEVTLQLRPDQLPARNLRGRLVDAMGTPTAGATVAVTRTGDDALFVRRSAATGEDGRFDIGPLPAGSYAITVGEMRSARAVGTAVVAMDRDEDIGDLQGGR